MKRLLVSAVMVVATLSLSASAVLAGSPSGNGTTTFRYSATYDNPILGTTTVCTGIHQHGPQWPGDATSGGRDVFTCRSTTGPFLYVDPGQVFEMPAYTWGSDYFGFTFGIGVPNTYPFRVRISGDDRSFQAIVYYF